MRVVGQGRMTLLSHPSKNPPCATTTTAFPIAQIIPGCLYFTSFTADGNTDNNNVPKNNAKTIYVDIDSHVHYDAFYDDFGPLNLAVLYRFCQFLHTLVLQYNNKTGQSQQKKRIFLYTNADPKCRVNAVFLIASYMVLLLLVPRSYTPITHKKIIYHNLTTEQAYLRLQCAEPPPFVGFRDAALGPPSYLLHVQHVIKSIEKAQKFKWLDFSRFDADEYEHFERVENGDLNWIVPGKLLSFCGPHDRSYIDNGYPYHSPEVYFDYFRAHNVTTIVRLNKKIYDAKRFTDTGFAHHDLFFIDGSTPNEQIVLRFLEIVDSTKGAIAVHCKAGLGRTGCMIACWMMKHFRLTAPQCMGWLRVCRPGSVIGPQQQFLIEKQAWCWKLGKAKCNSTRFTGIESEEDEENDKLDECGQKMTKPNGIVSSGSTQQSVWSNMAARQMNNTLAEESVVVGDTGETVVTGQQTALNLAGQSQGDRLCEIKARVQLRQQQNGHYSSSTAGPSAKFIAPPSVSAFVAEQPTALEGETLSNKNNSINGHASSATTPIKQLKLSSSIGGQAPAFVKINSNIGTHHHTMLLSSATATSPKKPNGRHIMDINNRCGDGVQQQRQEHPQQRKNPIAVINKLPIQNVSVSSTSRRHNLQPLSTPSRVHLHRKHLTAAASRLKPYQPLECEKTFTKCSTSSSATAQRFASQMATTTQLSAQNNFGKSLKKQYSAISASCQQQQKGRYEQNISNNNNNTNSSGGTKGTSTVSTNCGWTSTTMDSGGGGSSLLAHRNNDNNTCYVGCKYELRPRDQLNLPSRFASEQPPPMMNGGVATSNNTTNNNGTSASGNSSNNPFFLTRHQKTIKSTGTFFPTSSRL